MTVRRTHHVAVKVLYTISPVASSDRADVNPKGSKLQKAL